MNDELDNELNDELEFDLTEEELNDDPDEQTGEENVEFDYDDDGNVIIPDDSEDEKSEQESGEEEGDTVKEQDGTDVKDDNTSVEEVEPAKVSDAKDIEIENLRKQLAERDIQIRDTLKSLGADENEGIAGLERLAAEATEIPIEEYRKKKAEKIQQEEAMRLVKKQMFDEKIRSDLAAVQRAYPETKTYNSVYDFPNFAKFSQYRDLGLPPEEAYIAANPKSVMNSVADAAKQQTLNLNNKEHLRSNVPKGSKDKSTVISKKQMTEYKELFPNLSDKEIVALYKQTIKK